MLQINVLELYGLVAFGLPTRARQYEKVTALPWLLDLGVGGERAISRGIIG